MIKKYFFLTLLLFYTNFLHVAIAVESNIYEKIDLFGEVLEKINKEYVDEIKWRRKVSQVVSKTVQLKKILDPQS